MKKSIYSKVSIIILNWNGWEDTIECLESLYQINYPNFDVILVDNGSDNDSIEKINKYCNGELKVKSKFFEYETNNKPIKIIEFEEKDIDTDLVDYLTDDLASKIVIIKNKVNHGFTTGNNIGMKYAIRCLSPDYILLLNNDTVIKKNFLEELVRIGNENEKIGFLGPKIYFYDLNSRDDVIQCAGAEQNLWLLRPKNRGIFEIDQGQYNNIETVDYVHGSCVLAKLEMIEQIGMLDEDFFSYREENDWGIRGYNHGWTSLYVPSSVIWHKGGKSAGGYLSPLTVFYLTRNDFLLIKKHGNIFQIILYYLYFSFFKFWFNSAFYLIYHKNYNSFVSFLKGAKDGVFWGEKK